MAEAGTKEANGEPAPFDAAQYSFFGGLQDGDSDALGGGLEEGVEAPPEEELEQAEVQSETGLDEHGEDLSYAMMLATRLRDGGVCNDSFKQEEVEDQARGQTDQSASQSQQRDDGERRGWQPWPPSSKDLVAVSTSPIVSSTLSNYLRQNGYSQAGVSAPAQSPIAPPLASFPITRPVVGTPDAGLRGMPHLPIPSQPFGAFPLDYRPATPQQIRPAIPGQPMQPAAPLPQFQLGPAMLTPASAGGAHYGLPGAASREMFQTMGMPRAAPAPGSTPGAVQLTPPRGQPPGAISVEQLEAHMLAQSSATPQPRQPASLPAHPSPYQTPASFGNGRPGMPFLPTPGQQAPGSGSGVPNWYSPAHPEALRPLGPGLGAPPLPPPMPVYGVPMQVCGPPLPPFGVPMQRPVPGLRPPFPMYPPLPPMPPPAAAGRPADILGPPMGLLGPHSLLFGGPHGPGPNVAGGFALGMAPPPPVRFAPHESQQDATVPRTSVAFRMVAPLPETGQGRLDEGSRAGLPARPPEQLQGAALFQHLLRHGSLYMEPAELDLILRIQWKSLHMGSPYVEDFYYQAYVAKHADGRNTHVFAPDMLRELAPAERAGGEPASYVKLEGLGKIPFANIRRPKPLMELMPAAPKDGAELVAEGRAEAEKAPPSPSPALAAPRRPLEEEPLLAARMVVEDGLCLLLDVQDIDRLWAARGMRDDEPALRHRRTLLLEAFASSMRLAEVALPPDTAAADGVFLRLVALHKGRDLLSRALRTLTAPLAVGASTGASGRQGTSPLRATWALLRNVRSLFGASRRAGPAGGGPGGGGGVVAVADAAAREATLTSTVAFAALEVMRRLETPAAVCECMAALVGGDLRGPAPDDTTASPADALLPLFAAGETHAEHAPWLAEVLVALIQRAQELGLSEWTAERHTPQDDLPAPPEGRAWHAAWASFAAMLQRHMDTLLQVDQLASAAGVAEAAAYARAIVPLNLIRAALLHATPAQRDALRVPIAALT